MAKETKPKTPKAPKAPKAPKEPKIETPKTDVVVEEAQDQASEEKQPEQKKESKKAPYKVIGNFFAHRKEFKIGQELEKVEQEWIDLKLVEKV